MSNGARPTTATSPSSSPSASARAVSSVAAPRTRPQPPPEPSSPPRPPSSRSWFNAAARRPRTSPGPKPSPFKTRSAFADADVKRDSGFAPSTARLSAEGDGSAPDMPSLPTLPTILVQHHEPPRHQPASNVSDDFPECLSRIETEIPAANLDLSDDKLDFSKRGTLLINGKRMTEMMRAANEHESKRESTDGGHGSDGERLARPATAGPTTPSPEPQTEVRRAVSAGGPSPHGTSTNTSSTSTLPSRSRTLAPRRNIPPSRLLSADETMLSKKVRSMYEYGDERAAEWVVEPRVRVDGAIAEESPSPSPAPEDGDSLQVTKSRQTGDPARNASVTSKPGSLIAREPHEIAGGIEDWEDIEGAEVDRYGFIVPKKVVASPEQGESMVKFEAPKLQRVATQLQLASESPRRKRTLRRTTSNARSSRTNFSANGPRRQSSSRSLRPPESLYSVKSTASSRSNPFRFAANRLPHNRERRWVDEASDMLTLPPGLAAIAEEKESGRTATMMKRKEWQREEKWRKMGRVVGKSINGGGMMFEFDTRSPKLIERTWKGIPDRWRSSAWHAFLAASANKVPGSATDEELVEAFYELQDADSADDMQIDVDVPRTINHHIMFRRRYRGGQRLLFRVLHAMSLYLPDTGYVQGMAALAATLLCYYDEERAFVMLVRLWKFRGLERLYQSGFGGLMEALGEFETHWLCGGEVSQKLEELGIHCTAYGTRWYLTLFNYSIPFPAQLRVWDVFMLLGDAATSCTPGNSFNADLDVLHATSAALIDATRDILLDADFENAMKTLTSWIPVKDEELLMRVAKAEWKQRKKRANAHAAPPPPAAAAAAAAAAVE